MSRISLLFFVSLLSACAILPGGKRPKQTHIYLLETHLVESRGDAGCEIVVVNPPENAPGHVGSQMLYQRKPNQIERFAFSRWAASPAVMIEPLLLDALRAGHRYSAVLPSPAPVRADLRIENDDLWLIQRFDGERSFIEMRLSSRIYAPAQRRLIASQDFSYNEPADQPTPAAGVVAADRAVQRLLRDYSAFVEQAANDLGNHCRAAE